MSGSATDFLLFKNRANPTLMKATVNLFILFLVSLAVLTGCGIKPGNVSAPQGEDKDTFPHDYPAKSTFPRAESR